MTGRRASRAVITASLGLEGDTVTSEAVTRWLAGPPDRSWPARTGVRRRALPPLCLVYSGAPAEASLARHLGAVLRRLRGRRLSDAVSANARATISAGRCYVGTVSCRLVTELATQLDRVDIDLLLRTSLVHEPRGGHRSHDVLVHSVRGREVAALHGPAGRLGVLDLAEAAALGLTRRAGGVVSIILRSTSGQMGVTLARGFLRALSSSAARLVLDAATVEPE